MNSRLTAVGVAGLFVGALFCQLLCAQEKSLSARDVLSATAYTSADPAGRDIPFEVAVVLKIRENYHINARDKSADYLIAPDLRAEPPAGFKIGEVTYPKGVLRNFTFAKTKLNVYEGTVILRMPVTALANAPLGAQEIPMKLRYQACSIDICLPPVTVDVKASVNVVASSASAKPAHLEIFSSH